MSLQAIGRPARTQSALHRLSAYVMALLSASPRASLNAFPAATVLTACLVPLLLASLTACSDPKAAAESRTYQMGERVDVGGVVYTVLESEWRAAIGEGAGAMIPKDRFLILRVTITNGAGQPANLPFLHLEGAKQPDGVMEVDNAKGLAGWLGLVRIIPPAQTEEGKLVFDVPPASYKLRVSNGSGDNEVTRLVEIPYNVADSPVRTN